MTRSLAANAARIGLAAVLLAGALGAAACRAKPKDFDNENDALRRRVASLEAELADTQARSREIEARYEAILRAGQAPLAPDVADALPACAGVAIERLTGLVDTDQDGRADAIDVYIRPFDGRRRFVQIVGAVSIDAFTLPVAVGAGTAPDPVRLGAASLSPMDLRDAYRSSPLGTHYSVRMPIAPRDKDAGSVVVRVEFRDAISGLIHRAERIVGE